MMYGSRADNFIGMKVLLGPISPHSESTRPKSCATRTATVASSPRLK